MRIRPGSAAYVALAFAFLSCSDNGPLSPVARPVPLLDVAATALPTVRISEFHYDDVGADTDEKIEVSGPAGTVLTGWQLVLYNGNPTQRSTYSPTGGAINLTGVIIPATCGARGVVVLNAVGLQNGGSLTSPEPDGFALVDPSGTVVEFLSYEGSFIAANGPAAGRTSTDIGVSENGETDAPKVSSLKRDGAGVWSGPTPNNFGECNDADELPPAIVAHVVVTPADASIPAGTTQQFLATATTDAGVPISGVVFTWSIAEPVSGAASVDASGLAKGLAIGDAMIIATAPNGVADTSSLHVSAALPPAGLPETRFSEIHYDNTGTDIGERIEIEGPAGKDVTGWSIVLYNGNGGVTYGTSTFSGTIPATCGTRGVLVIDYPQDGIQNGSPDGFALVDNTGAVVEFLSYEGTFTATNGPVSGLRATDIGQSEPGADGSSLHRNNDGIWETPAVQNFGYCYGQTPPPPPNGLTFTGRVPTDPPLPVGFEDQLFATEHLGTGGTLTTTFTWKSETPDVASIDANGVMHALRAGTATFRATAEDGTTNTYTLPTTVATASTTALYGNNTEFGDPADWDDSDDFIIRRAQYTTSFNKNRNTPNWVSYDLEATHIGSEVDRCDCFTQDPKLPSSYTHITTANYTGAGAFAGYGIDRGHLARSFDRTTGSLDNATTYYFSNIIPQAADVNQGPWAIMENYLGDKARFENKEVYIVAGVAGSIGTVKDSGKLVIPEKVWKVAVIMEHDRGLADVHDYRDVEVVAVIMPNVPGVRNVDWHTYQATVDAVEALSGYDLLSLLPDKIERAVESNTEPPFAALDGPYTSTEGSAVAMSGAASFDPNGTVTSYAWNFGDGIESSGIARSHTYAQDGDYTVRLIVTDNDGLADTTTSAVHVSNVAPTILPFDGATLLPGETYRADGSFTDPGADLWSGTVNYGDGSGVGSLTLANKTFSLSHAYGVAGTYTVTVGISDDDATSTSTRTVTVWTLVQGVQNASAIVFRLAKDGQLSAGNAISLTAKLDAAKKQLDSGNTNAASGQLGAVLNELNAMVRSDRLAETDAAPVRSLVQRVLQSIGR
jgi:DNA/RNA endonuclease G (NUC1)